jgi:Fic family protein
MQDILSRIDTKKHLLESLRPMPEELLQNLEDWLRVELTYSSNAIEGNTLSRIETAQVLEKGVKAVIRGKPLKDQIEAINHARAIEFIKQLKRERKGHQFITEKDILDIHRIILTGIWDEWAVKYRNTDVFIRGSDAKFPRPYEVAGRMKEFITWLASTQEGHAVTIAADAHYKFVTIHPFIDGNGRITRLLMNLILILNGYPMAVIRNEDRTSYLQSFEQARKNENLTQFYQLVYTAVERSLDLYLAAAQGRRPPLKTFFSVKTQRKKHLKIGELAQASGETVPTIRYWTKEGLLKVAYFSTGGYQLYAPVMIERVKKIRELQHKKRLTIKEIKRQLD